MYASGFYILPARRSLGLTWSTTGFLCSVFFMKRCPGFFVNRRLDYSMEVELHSCCRSDNVLLVCKDIVIVSDHYSRQQRR